MRFAAIVAIAVACSSTLAAEELSSREMDVWGRFGVGSWKQTRIVSEALDDTGKVTSTSSTDVRTLITKVDLHHVTLRINVTVEAGGKHYDAEAQTVQHGYYGEGPGQIVRLRELGKTDVTIDSISYPCQMREAVMDDGRQKTVAKLFETAAQRPSCSAGKRCLPTSEILPPAIRKRPRSPCSTCPTRFARR